jgi:hypothetical protein
MANQLTLNDLSAGQIRSIIELVRLNGATSQFRLEVSTDWDGTPGPGKIVGRIEGFMMATVSQWADIETEDEDGRPEEYTTVFLV